MAQNRVDAKIELIRVEIQHEIDRLKNTVLESPTSDQGRFNKLGRIAGLEYALRTIAQVEERVR